MERSLVAQLRTEILPLAFVITAAKCATCEFHVLEKLRNTFLYCSHYNECLIWKASFVSKAWGEKKSGFICSILFVIYVTIQFFVLISVFILLFWHLARLVSVVFEGLVRPFGPGIFMHGRLTKFKSNNVKVCMFFWRQNKKAEQREKKKRQAESETCPFPPHVREKIREGEIRGRE